MTEQEFEWNCVYRPVQVAALAENGDAIASFRQDAPGTLFSPNHYLKVWRAGAHEWQTVVELLVTEYAQFDVAISDTGAYAVRHIQDNGGSVSWTSNGHALESEGVCPSYGWPAVPLAVNDAAEAVGLLYCGESDAGVGVRWSPTGIPTRLGGTPSIIDNFGNAAGIRDGDGHAVVWLADGSVIDLSAAVGSQPASVRKFLKRGQVFGFVGTQPVIWRFGF